MKNTTMSLCEQCYRHIPAKKFQRGRSLWIGKTCPEHGYSEFMMEREALFLEQLNNDINADNKNGYVIEITDRCNLTCPHCYQMPDNRKIDKPLEELINNLKTYPDDGESITLAGAEPTMRKDLFDIIRKIKNLNLEIGHKPRVVNILTNGIMLEREDYVKKLIEAGTDSVTIGLNHPDYQGVHTHKRQLLGIDNCNKLGLRIKNINYTIENLNQISFILQEIQTFKDIATEFRIRGGADIGRYPSEEDQIFLSDIVYEVYRQCEKLNYTWNKISADDNIYHYTVEVNSLQLRLIQWASAENVDLDELRCGPWGSFVPGIPITNLMHQVMLRDAVINKGLALKDSVPQEYCR
jgi:molybdenum cofactor biosynthesis enzyme MoaA